MAAAAAASHVAQLQCVTEQLLLPPTGCRPADLVQNKCDLTQHSLVTTAAFYRLVGLLTLSCGDKLPTVTQETSFLLLGLTTCPPPIKTRMSSAFGPNQTSFISESVGGQPTRKQHRFTPESRPIRNRLQDLGCRATVCVFPLTNVQLLILSILL